MQPHETSCVWLWLWLHRFVDFFRLVTVWLHQKKQKKADRTGLWNTNCNQPSAAVTVQNKHADALEHVACSVYGLSKTMANHMLTTNNDVCKQAATSLKAHISDYSVKDYLVLGMYLMAEKNKHVAIFFATLEGVHQKTFLDECLKAIEE